MSTDTLSRGVGPSHAVSGPRSPSSRRSNIVKLVLFLCVVGGYLLLTFVLRDQVGTFHVVFPAAPQASLPESRVAFRRHSPSGVIEMWAAGELDGYRALGYAHAMDRGTQLMLARLAASGQLSQHLQGSEQLVDADTWLRSLGFLEDAEVEAGLLSPGIRQMLEAYAAGINHFFATGNRPIELLLVGYRPSDHPWTPVDTLAFIKLLAYMGLASNDGDIEKMVVMWSQREVSFAALQQVFSPLLDAVPDGVRELWLKVKLVRTPIPAELTDLVPAMSGSNNWAIAAHRSASGHAFYASDPHLEVSRLPPIWHEVLIHIGDGGGSGAPVWVGGISAPGAPAVLMGRTEELAFGLTYGCADQIDYLIEEIDERGFYRVDETTWAPPTRSASTIIVKQGKPVSVFFFATPRGRIERADNQSPTLAPGFYMARSTAIGGQGMLEAVRKGVRARSVFEFQDAILDCDLTANWIVADAGGNIGYQQTARVAKRAHSGAFPVPAWESRYHWTGFHAPSSLVRITNPADGVLASANNEIHPLEPAGVKATMVHMGPYRHSRVLDLLNDTEKLTLDDMKRIQNDLFSQQAAEFMPILRPLLPPRSDVIDILAEWNLVCDRDSLGCMLFERWYQRVRARVMGVIFGSASWQAMTETGHGLMWFYWYDRFLLELDSHRQLLPADFPRRDELFAMVAAEVLAEADSGPFTWHHLTAELPTWSMPHIFFEGKLLKTLTSFFSIELWELPSEGCRGCIVQFQRGVILGRERRSGASWRFVAEVGGADRGLHTALPGGNSGRLVSQFYGNRMWRWIDHQYDWWGPSKHGADEIKREL